MRKIFLQWAGAGILALIGWGVDTMPNNTSWIPSFVIWGIALVWAVLVGLYWLKKRRSRAKVTMPPIISEQSKQPIEVLKAFVSDTKTETISGITRLSHFSVKVELALHTNEPNLHLSWIRLNIGGESLDSVKSIPQIKDSIQYSEQAYELIFEVPVKTFLKARYSVGSIRPDKSNPEAQIYMKANGQDWYSEPFSIQSSTLQNV